MLKSQSAPLTRCFAIPIEFKHDNEDSVEKFLQNAVVLGNRDMSRPLQILQDHWVNTVADLRLLVQEGQLRTVGLPFRLCFWMEEELGALALSQASHQPSFMVQNEVVQGKVVQNSSSASTYIEFAYTGTDFCSRGILHFLGTHGYSRSWTNPAQDGLVDLTTSGLLSDSYPLHYIVGKSVVRCVTASNENGFVCIDFKGMRVRASHYTLRHYSSWDTECLRNWQLEGSDDGARWELLRRHKYDTSLNGKGATHTWDLPSTQPFRMFRLMLTGPNSNRHHYLACSGFELYGTLYDSPFPDSMGGDNKQEESSIPSLVPPPPLPRSAHEQQQLPAKQFTYSHDFDENGICYFLATHGGNVPWSNPCSQGLVNVTASSVMTDSVPMDAVVGLSTVRCVTRAFPNSWVCIDFIGRRIAPSHYTIRHYSSWDTEALRCWQLQGSVDGSTWTVLVNHVNDESLQVRGGSHTWEVPQNEPTFFSMFRILQTSENSNKHHFLAISGFEIYGTLLTNSSSIESGEVKSSSSDNSSNSGSSALDADEKMGALERIKGKLLQFDYSGVDFDDNGIVHNLGTNFNTAQWINPDTKGLVKVVLSSLVADSASSSAVVGKRAVRCVTKPEPGSWVKVDFLDNSVQPTHYTIRHYSSWDTEALRSWRFQGSQDGVSWTTLKTHSNDTSLKTKGGSHTWALPASSVFYSLFRLLQTGPNSNNHHYLAISGFELYGTLAYTGSLPESKSSNPAGMLPGQVGLSDIKACGSSASDGSSSNLPSEVAKLHTDLVWDDASLAPFLEVERGTLVFNTGSNDKWQLARTTKQFSQGVQVAVIKIVHDLPTSNTWKFIVGVVGAKLDGQGTKQWVGANGSWGYILGTGGKCHQEPRSVPYGSKCDVGDEVAIVMDFGRQQISFFKNGVLQGVAYSNLVGPVHVAASLTGTDSRLALCHQSGYPLPFQFQQNVVSGIVPLQGTQAEEPNIQDDDSSSSGVVKHDRVAVNLSQSVHIIDSMCWDPDFLSSFMKLDDQNQSICINTGSKDKWQSVRSRFCFSAEKARKHYFDVQLNNFSTTPNSWKAIVGVVPHSFTCSGNRQWVGAGKSWGYIGGTGGKCYHQAASLPYGVGYGENDVIGCELDFDLNTVEFFHNGISQGVAFDNLTGPVYAAVSLTATNSSVRLKTVWSR